MRYIKLFRYICPYESLAQLVQSAALTGQRSPVRARHGSLKENSLTM